MSTCMRHSDFSIQLRTAKPASYESAGRRHHEGMLPFENTMCLATVMTILKWPKVSTTGEKLLDPLLILFTVDDAYPKSHRYPIEV